MASAKERFYANQLKKGNIDSGQYTTIMGTAPSSGKSASDLINANQVSDAAKKATDNSPAIRSSITNYQNIIGDMGGTKLSDIKAPDLPNYETAYTGLRGQYGVDTLESSMNDLNTQKADVQAQFNTNKTAENGKPVAMGVIAGRISEEGQQAQDKVDFIDRQINTVTGQLNTAYNVINSLMNFKQMDYSAAKEQYDSQFSQNMQMFNMVKGIDDSIKSDQQHEADVARSNLQIMYNSIAANSDGVGSLSKSQKTMITKLEVQAGLPAGFYNTIQAKNPGGTIISTTTRTDASGNKYADIITLDPKTGAPKTSSTFLGKDSSGSSSASNKSDILSANENYIYNQLSGASKGKDGFVDPSIWRSALKTWQDSGGSTADFMAKFGGKTATDNMNNQVRVSGFINPKDM